MTQEIIEAISNSEYFKRLNAVAKATYEKENRRPSDEEYQTLRNILICKTMLEDEAVKHMVSQSVWNELH